VTGVVIDSSAIVAIIAHENGWERLTAELWSARERLMSAATLTESGIVMENRSHPYGFEAVERLIREARLSVISLDRDDAEAAVAAWRRFGRGRQPARLNYGDCFTYALAERTGYPILCAGNDFAQTDLEVFPAY
jgi:ribonuclease VapC